MGKLKKGRGWPYTEMLNIDNIGKSGQHDAASQCKGRCQIVDFSGKPGGQINSRWAAGVEPRISAIKATFMCSNISAIAGESDFSSVIVMCSLINCVIYSDMDLIQR